jgi:predicted site-specific integrase-resolvase
LLVEVISHAKDKVYGRRKYKYKKRREEIEFARDMDILFKV